MNNLAKNIEHRRFRCFFILTSILVLLTLLWKPPILHSATDLRTSLYSDIEDGHLTLYSPIEAAFIISGTISHDSLRTAIQWYNGLLEDIQQKRLIDDFERESSAEKLFHYLHTTWLKTYQRESTTLLDIKHRKNFNCVAATILYNYLCDDLGLSTMAFETPTHVYTIFTNFGDQVMVENTSPFGFNIIKNLQNYSRYMAMYYPENDIYKIGLHRLYAYENSKGRKINNLELLGLISYNQAIFSADKNNYEQSYEFVLMAQLFNEDSRSNEQFEINLYFRWGKQLFDTRRYYDAFEVFADANYRYPDDANFRKNCLVAFHRTLEIAWRKKDWATAKTVIEEIEELDILDRGDKQNTEHHLLQWGHYFFNAKRKLKGGESIVLLKLIGSRHSAIRKLERGFDRLP